MRSLQKGKCCMDDKEIMEKGVVLYEKGNG